MKSIPIVLAGLAALAAARPPTSEELCVGFNGDIDACQRESKVCFDEIEAKKELFTWTKLFKCTQARIPSASSSAAPAAAAPTTTSMEELCVGPNRGLDLWVREYKGCFDEIQGKEGFTRDKVADCIDARVSSLCSSALSAAAAPTTTPEDKPAPPQDGIADVDGKRPPRSRPTKEELCVGFNGDFDTCQRESKDCLDKLGDQADWFTLFDCLQARRPSASSSAAPAAAATPTTTPQDKPAPPQNSSVINNNNNNNNNNKATANKADIRVDTNRDGIVDVDGTSDQAGKDTWTDAAGAIFLPNIADSGDRCKKLHADLQLPKQLATMYDTLAKCHDAADDEQRAPQNLAPMRTVPMTGLSDSATGTISVADEKSRALVRVFRQSKDGKWEIVNNDTVFTAQDLRDGLTLGVDARDTRRPDWDGRVKVDFSVGDGQNESKDTVMLRVAPVLLQHHRQAVNEVLTSGLPKATGDFKAYLDKIMSGIQSSMKAAGITGPLTRLPNNDAWAQDYFEPAYASMPGPNKTVVALRVIIEGRHDPRLNSTSIIYTTLRGDGVGAVAQQLPRQANLEKRSSDFDAGGNLESIPPYELNGKKYPAGRIIVGGDSQRLPVGMDFFKAQEVQAPLVLDSTWLAVKHVNEMVQAVPAKTPRGWAIMAIDPEMGLKMLRDAEAAGHGDQSVTGRQRTGPTIAQFLSTESNMVAAEVAAKAMAANIEMLKKETGLSDAEIHRVPALISLFDLSQKYVHRSSRRRGISSRDESAEAALDQEFMDNFPSHLLDEDDDDDDEVAPNNTTEQRRRAAATKPPRYSSVLPSLVNGVPLSDSHYLAPQPFGTIIDRKYIFQEAATAAFKKAGFTTVDYLEEWRIHSAFGDLHCMSNTFRDISEPWW
ncbi:Protein-arginine deiminase type-4 [Beauveria bassiana]|nr:Protein-arginine deiminase type-4 [Beauveria bassiana]KAH8707764.1 Protein-arginine deiminase type-4 [Beauveria bassiana]